MMTEPLSRRFLIVVADLSLILFLVTASALPDDPVTARAAPAPPAPHETPVMLGVWSDVPGGITLSAWLAEQAPDSSQRLSIEVTYREGGIEAAFAKAEQLRLSAGAAGNDARVLIAEGPRDAVLAQLVQDNAPASAPAAAATGPDIAQRR
jgi:hypothetical protein